MCSIAQWCPTLWPHGLQPTRLLCPWDFPNKNTEVGCHFLLQGFFPIQGSNLHVLHWHEDSWRSHLRIKTALWVFFSNSLSWYSLTSCLLNPWRPGHGDSLSRHGFLTCPSTHHCSFITLRSALMESHEQRVPFRWQNFAVCSDISACCLDNYTCSSH